VEAASRALETEQEFWDGMCPLLPLSFPFSGQATWSHWTWCISGDTWANWLLELDTIVTPERDTYEHIDDVLRAFIDLAARHKCTTYFHYTRKRW
jgi:hypothetical protein